MTSDETPPLEPAQRWESPWSPAVDEALGAQGYRRVRLLHQMRRPLPLDDEVVRSTRTISVRPFTRDDTDGVLRVNNRAFPWHPEQGGWDAERLAATMSEPWFSAEGFLVHDTDGVVDGFCWTKVHPARHDDEPEGPRPAAGEIFVIAADPDSHGTGLGRALTVAGLTHLAELGLELALLYVEADNEPAISMYERLGFRVHHSDAGYAR